MEEVKKERKYNLTKKRIQKIASAVVELQKCDDIDGVQDTILVHILEEFSRLHESAKK